MLVGCGYKDELKYRQHKRASTANLKPLYWVLTQIYYSQQKLESKQLCPIECTLLIANFYKRPNGIGETCHVFGYISSLETRSLSKNLKNAVNNLPKKRKMKCCMRDLKRDFDNQTIRKLVANPSQAKKKVGLKFLLLFVSVKISIVSRI